MKYFPFIFTFSLAIHSAVAQHVKLPTQRVQNPIPRDVEVIYSKGLSFLKSTQSADGSWSNSTGSYGTFPGVVSLSLLSFLAHGDDPNHGPYSKNIQNSIDYLLSKQQKNGYIGSHSLNDPRGNMYNHGFAILALAEAYGMVDDKRIGPALQKAVDLTLTSQKTNTVGAWRYSPTARDSDSTVAGCQIVSLYAARNAGIPIPEEALEKAAKYMKSCYNESNGSYSYTNKSSSARMTLTAIGVLCQALAKKKDTPEFKKSVEYLKDNLNYKELHYPAYFEYYMSQALFHADEETWKIWNKKNIQFLKILQRSDGSFNVKGKIIYPTSAYLLSLALNYRFLPIYEK